MNTFTSVHNHSRRRIFRPQIGTFRPEYSLCIALSATCSTNGQVRAYLQITKLIRNSDPVTL